MNHKKIRNVKSRRELRLQQYFNVFLPTKIFNTRITIKSNTLINGICIIEPYSLQIAFEQLAN